MILNTVHSGDLSFCLCKSALPIMWSPGAGFMRDICAGVTPNFGRKSSAPGRKSKKAESFGFMSGAQEILRGACDWFFWKRKSPLLSVRLGLFSSKKLFCLFHSASRREIEKSYKDGGHGTRIFSGNSVKWNNELWNLYDSCNSD